MGCQRKLGARKEQAAVNDGLEQAALSLGIDPGQEIVQTKACPGVIEDGQPSVIECFMKLDLGSRKKILPFERIGNEVTGRRR